jgi:hypothetical protein
LIGWAAFATLVVAWFAGVGAFNRATEMGEASPALFALAAALLAVVAAAIVILTPIAVLWWSMIRYNQRANLRQVGSLARFLETIGKEAGSVSPEPPRPADARSGASIESPA